MSHAVLIVTFAERLEKEIHVGACRPSVDDASGHDGVQFHAGGSNAAQYDVEIEQDSWDKSDRAIMRRASR